MANATAALGVRPTTKVTRRRTVNITRQTERFDLTDVIKDLGETGVRQLAYDIAAEEIKRQTANGNPPAGVFVDRREGKPVKDMRRNVVVLFEGLDARPAMRRIEAIAESIGRARGTYYWVVLKGSPALKSQVRRRTGPVLMEPGDAIAYVSDADEIGRENVYYRRGFDRIPNDGDDEAWRYSNRDRSRTRGFAGDAARKMRAAVGPDGWIVRALAGRGAGRLLPPPDSPFTNQPRVAQAAFSYVLRRRGSSKRRGRTGGRRT